MLKKRNWGRGELSVYGILVQKLGLAQIFTHYATILEASKSLTRPE